MRNDQLVKIAAEHLAAHSISREKLTSPLIQDAKVVYFDLEPDSRVMMVLDSKTGEPLSATFGPESFLKRRWKNLLRRFYATAGI